jgi:hypothetical protein
MNLYRSNSGAVNILRIMEAENGVLTIRLRILPAYYTARITHLSYFVVAKIHTILIRENFLHVSTLLGHLQGG